MALPAKFDPTPKAPKGWHEDRLKLPRRWMKRLSPRRDLPSGKLPIPSHVPEGSVEVVRMLFPEHQKSALMSPVQAADLRSFAPPQHDDPHGYAARLVDWFVHERGIEFALQASLYARTEYLTDDNGNLRWPLQMGTGFRDLSGERINDRHRLRYHLAALDNDAWESAREFAAAVRAECDPTSKSGLLRRTELTYLFASYRPWVTEDLEAYLVADTHTGYSMAGLLSSCLWNFDQFEMIKSDIRNIPELLPDLVHQFGPELGPWLRDMLSDHYVQIYARYTKDIRTALDLLAPAQSGQVELPGYLDIQLLEAIVAEKVDVPTFVDAVRRSGKDSQDAVLSAANLSADQQAEMAWALVEQWQASGVPKEDLWVLDGLGLFGNTETDARLGGFLRALRFPTVKKRALEVLAERGTVLAARQVLDAENSKLEKPVRAHATQLLDSWISEHGLDREQIQDRTVPDFGLGDDVVFDLGPRQVHMRLDAELRPELIDSKGTALRSFPRRAKADNPDLSASANERWKDLRKALNKTIEHETHRLELAMGALRTWTVTELRDVFLPHPILGSLVTRLVWCYDLADGGEVASFRFAEDRSLADAQDQSVELEAESPVRIAHPVRLGAAETVAWGEVFGDYELQQPFDQLARPCFATQAAAILGEYRNSRHNGGDMRRLVRRGWTREKKRFNGFERPFGELAVRVIVRAPGPESYVIASIEVMSAEGRVGWDLVPMEIASEVCLDLATVLES